MKCEAILINRGIAKYFKKAKFDESKVTIKKFRQTDEYYIPAGTQFLQLEKRIRTRPLWILDEMTHKALGWSFDYKITEEKGKKFVTGAIIISEKSDPTTKFKLNVLSKTSFWEMLAKKLKLNFMSMIIYMGAGYGLFRFAEYAFRIIFLKEG